MSDELRALLQTFIRRFGLLAADTTPCGKPLATSDAHALLILAETGAAGLLQTDLRGALGVDKSTASRVVARLDERGHVEPAAPSADGRAKPVRLTAKGARLAGEIDRASRRRFGALLAGIPAGRRDPVLRALRDVVAALDHLQGKEEDPS